MAEPVQLSGRALGALEPHPTAAGLSSQNLSCPTLGLTGPHSWPQRGQLGTILSCVPRVAHLLQGPRLGTQLRHVPALDGVVLAPSSLGLERALVGPISFLRQMCEPPWQNPELGAGFWLITSPNGELSTPQEPTLARDSWGSSEAFPRTVSPDCHAASHEVCKGVARGPSTSYVADPVCDATASRTLPVTWLSPGWLQDSASLRPPRHAPVPRLPLAHAPARSASLAGPGCRP